MYVCMHVCMYICVCVCVYVYVCMYVYVYVCMYVCMVCMYVMTNNSKISIHRFIATTLFVWSKNGHTQAIFTNDR